MKKFITIIVIIVVVIAGWWYFAAHKAQAPATGGDTTGTSPVNTVSYACDGGKTITAAFYQGEATPSTDANTPPTPGGSAKVDLSDGRSLTLPQTISADGARYANADESFVFWSKGNGALVLENNQQTYMGCVQVAKDPGGLSQVYSNGTEGFSIRYPQGFTPDENYAYQELGPGKSISGVKFTIDPSIATGTNLGSDSYLSVEEIPQAQSCSANLFLDQAGTAKTITENGTDYSVASSTGAGAGNRYEETVYALPGTNPCVGVRYFVHYGVIENYPAGAVKEFDRQSLLSTFDSMRKTLILNPTP
jgi:membrane-bound inhibitor of C-type lysozyme